jgi:hypothetical protein
MNIEYWTSVRERLEQLQGLPWGALSIVFVLLGLYVGAINAWATHIFYTRLGLTASDFAIVAGSNPAALAASSAWTILLLSIAALYSYLLFSGSTWLMSIPHHSEPPGSASRWLRIWGNTARAYLIVAICSALALVLVRYVLGLSMELAATYERLYESDFFLGLYDRVSTFHPLLGSIAMFTLVPLAVLLPFLGLRNRARQALSESPEGQGRAILAAAVSAPLLLFTRELVSRGSRLLDAFRPERGEDTFGWQSGEFTAYVLGIFGVIAIVGPMLGAYVAAREDAWLSMDGGLRHRLGRWLLREEPDSFLSSRNLGVLVLAVYLLALPGAIVTRAIDDADRVRDGQTVTQALDNTGIHWGARCVRVSTGRVSALASEESDLVIYLGTGNGRDFIVRLSPGQPQSDEGVIVAQPADANIAFVPDEECVMGPRGE